MMKIGRLPRAPFFMADFLQAAGALRSRQQKALIQKWIVVAALEAAKSGTSQRHENFLRISYLRKLITQNRAKSENPLTSHQFAAL